MFRFALMTLVALSFVQARAGADSTRRTTVSVLEEHLHSCLNEITTGIHAGERVRLVVASHPDSLWIHTATIQVVNERGGIVESGEGGTAARQLTITPVDLSTSYTNTEDVDSVLRTITTALRGTLDTPQRGISSVPCSSIVQEKLTREQAERFQSDQHHATGSALPPAPTTMWQDILEPVIFIGAAVITAVLLFTVRSQ